MVKILKFDVLGFCKISMLEHEFLIVYRVVYIIKRSLRVLGQGKLEKGNAPTHTHKPRVKSALSVASSHRYLFICFLYIL